MNGKRIVLIRLRSLGDTLLMTPALSIASSGGLNEVAVVVEKPYDQLLKGNPELGRLIVPGTRGDLRSRWKSIKEIREFKPELVFDMYGGPTSSLMAFLSGADYRVGYAVSRNSMFYNVKIPHFREIWHREKIHTVEHQLSPMIRMGFPVREVPPLYIHVEELEREKAAKRLAAEGIDGDFVLIHPAASYASKQWSSRGFAFVAGELEKSGIRCVATAGPGQEKLLHELAAASGPGLVLFPPGSLAEFVALASLCTLYLGNDTGPTHVAAALRKKVVVVFGSSDYAAWHPWGTEYRLIRSELDCIPCPGSKCLHYPEPECIKSIAGSRVLSSVMELLSGM